MLPHKAVVVVADGQSATIYRNEARHGLDLTETEHLTPASIGDYTARGLPDEKNPDDDDEATFAVQLARHLNAMVLKHKLDDVAIIADPSTLGVLRKHYHKELQLRLRKEVPKTLTNSDIQAIQSALA